MNEHILLSKAYIYPIEAIKPELAGCTFDQKKGYWIVNATGQPYVLDKSMSSPPKSKKCDIETGEDQKGE